jgi:preprotein translocase subunit SecD
MSKLTRFFIVLITVGVCFAFLYPTLKWYFWTSPEDKQLALESIEQIREDAVKIAANDYKRLLAAAEAGEALPEDFKYLVRDAKAARQVRRVEIPAAWDAKNVLFSFENRQIIENIIENQVRTRIFAIKDTQKNAVQLGLDLSGGLSIVLQADLVGYEAKIGHTLSQEEHDQAMEQALGALNEKIDQFGLTEPVIRRQGTDQIYIEIPGAADPERINSIIMGKGSLTFRMVDNDATSKFDEYYAANRLNAFNDDGSLNDTSVIPEDDEVLGVYEKDQYGIDVFQGYMVVKKETGLDGNHIQNAQVSRDRISNQPEVIVDLDSEGADIFYNLTSANVGKLLAIVLDDRVQSAPRINGAIRGSVSITGNYSVEQANNLATMLRTAALPVDLNVVNQQTIGASMGADYIRQGLFALLGGLGVVFVFMLVFYKAAGINAIVAQVLNIYIMFSILSAFNFTLTLPSIAGFILTIGMAVDANVIVFERIKEELRLGKTRKAVIEAGFGKAFWAIMDSNITTFIAALFLSQLGSGPIQGFAVSLAIGVFSSVFTALFVSRLIFDFGTDTLHSKKVSIAWGIKRGIKQ